MTPLVFSFVKQNYGAQREDSAERSEAYLVRNINYVIALFKDQSSD